jgi:hypothetical protein
MSAPASAATVRRLTFAGSGHSDIRMTIALYTHATEGMQDFATAALEAAIS